MKNNKKHKPFLDYIDNRYGMIMGFSLILLSFIGILIFYLIQAPILKMNIYTPTKLYKSLFFISLFFSILGFVITQIYWLRIIHSLRTINKWTWRTKSKLQIFLITLPSWSFFILLIFMFASLFFSGMTMSSYGYNKFNIIYIIIALSFTSIVFIFNMMTFSSVVSSVIFQKLTSKYK